MPLLQKMLSSRLLGKVKISRIVLSNACYSNDIVHREDDGTIEIPKYDIERQETLEKRKARLLYQSRKRGMLENDLLLSTFAAKYLDNMTEEQTSQYDKLINLPTNDWDIYYWAVGHKSTPPEYDNEMMNLFKQHVENKNRDKRLRQPNLN